MDVPSGVPAVLLLVLAPLSRKPPLGKGIARASKTLSQWLQPKTERAATAFPPHRVNTILLRFWCYLIAPAVVGVVCPAL